MPSIIASQLLHVSVAPQLSAPRDLLEGILRVQLRLFWHQLRHRPLVQLEWDIVDARHARQELRGPRCLLLPRQFLPRANRHVVQRGLVRHLLQHCVELVWINLLRVSERLMSAKPL